MTMQLAVVEKMITEEMKKLLDTEMIVYLLLLLVVCLQQMQEVKFGGVISVASSRCYHCC